MYVHTCWCAGLGLCMEARGCQASFSVTFPLNSLRSLSLNLELHWRLASFTHPPVSTPLALQGSRKPCLFSSWVCVASAPYLLSHVPSPNLYCLELTMWWPWISDPPASTWVLGLQVWVTMFGLDGTDRPTPIHSLCSSLLHPFLSGPL